METREVKIRIGRGVRAVIPSPRSRFLLVETRVRSIFGGTTTETYKVSRKQVARILGLRASGLTLSRYNNKVETERRAVRQRNAATRAKVGLQSDFAPEVFHPQEFTALKRDATHVSVGCRNFQVGTKELRALRAWANR